MSAGLRALARSPLLLLWALFIAIFPFYVFDSGRPQPAHVVMVALVACVALDRRSALPRASHRYVTPLVLFVYYALAVGVAWAIVNENASLSASDGHLVHPLFYLFNASIFLTGLILHRRFGEDFLAATLSAVFVSLLIQVAGSFALGGGDGFRQSLWFNNPNQLGYYALLSATIFALLARRNAPSSLAQGVFFAAAAYISIVSLSRASMLSVGLLAAFTFLTRVRTVVIAALALLAVDALLHSSAEYVPRVQDRLTGASGTEGDGLAGRGYDRIGNHPEYWLLGAGEGDDLRFDSILEGELHSTFGTVFFAYGLPGTLLFALFAYRVAHRLDPRALLLLVPSVLYGLTHHGFRFSLGWIMLSVVVCIRLDGRAPRRAPRASELTPAPR